MQNQKLPSFRGSECTQTSLTGPIDLCMYMRDLAIIKREFHILPHKLFHNLGSQLTMNGLAVHVQFFDRDLSRNDKKKVIFCNKECGEDIWQVKSGL